MTCVNKGIKNEGLHGYTANTVTQSMYLEVAVKMAAALMHNG